MRSSNRRELPIADAVEQFVELMQVLNDDANSLLERAKKDPSALARRSAVRSVFAAIEGLVSATKDMIIEPLPHVRRHYSDAEVALLREETYVLTDKGDAIAQTRFLRLEDNVRFIWKMIVKEWGIDTEIDFSSDGWKAFSSSVKVRNRITHPRRQADMSISDSEFAQVEKGYMFVHSMTMRNIFRSLQAARHREYQRMDRSIDPRILQWLDALEEGGPSPLARPLTPEESRTLAELEAQCEADTVQSLRTYELVGGTDGAQSLLQRGADYRAWRLKNRAQGP